MTCITAPACLPHLMRVSRMRCAERETGPVGPPGGGRAPQVGHQLGRPAVVHGQLVHVHCRDAEPRARQQVARVAHLRAAAGLNPNPYPSSANPVRQTPCQNRPPGARSRL